MAFYDIGYKGRMDENGRVIRYPYRELVNGRISYDSSEGIFNIIREDASLLQITPREIFVLENFRGYPGKYIIEDNANGLNIHTENEFTGCISFNIGENEKPVCIDKGTKRARELDLSNVKSLRESLIE